MWQKIDRSLAGAFMVAPLVALIAMEGARTLWPEPAPRVQTQVMVVEVPADDGGADAVCEPATPAPEVEPAPAPEVEQATEPAPTEPGPFLFVVDGHLVLDSDADASWGTGRIDATLPHAGSLTVRQAAHPTHTPEGLRALVGERVALEGEDGVVCEAEIGPLSVVSRFQGDIELLYESEDSLMAGNEDDYEGAMRRRLLDGEVRQRVFESGPWLLEAELVRPSGDCTDAVWGHLVKDETVVVYQREDGDTPGYEPLIARAVAAVQGLDTYREMKEDYAEYEREAAEYGDEFEPWQVREERTLTVDVWSASGPGLEHSFVTVLIGEPGVWGCGDIEADMAVVLRAPNRADADAPLEVISENIGSIPAALIDREGDGQVEIVTGTDPTIERRLLAREPRRSPDMGGEPGATPQFAYEIVEDATIDHIGCPC